MIDIHTHILPYTDDGSTSIEESLIMLNMEYQQGIRYVFCTPHADCCNKETKTIFENLKTANNVGVHIFLGCEIYCIIDHIDDIIKRLYTGEYYTMNNSKFVLVEFDPYDQEENILYCCKRLLENNYIPIIAHIERYYNLKNYIKLKDMKCLMQINMYSLVKENEEYVKNVARDLLRQHYVDFVGSDAHRLTHRPPEMKSGIDYIYNTVDKEYANNITVKNTLFYLNIREGRNGTENNVV